MPIHKGTVSRVDGREFESKFNEGQKFMAYSFQLEGVNQWFRTKSKKPQFTQGAEIQFLAMDDGKGNSNVELDGVDVLTPGVPASAAPAQASGGTPPTSASSAPVTRDSYWANKEKNDKVKEEEYQTKAVPRMTYSGAQERAVALVVAALKFDALSFGTVAKGKKLDMLLEFVDQVTDRFLIQTLDSPDHVANIRQATIAGTSTDAGQTKQQQEEEYDYGDD